MEFLFEDSRLVYKDELDRVAAFVGFKTLPEDVLEIDHVFVASELRGRGLAGEMMKAMADNMRTSGKKAMPVCPYAVKWFGEHPEYKDVLAK